MHALFPIDNALDSLKGSNGFHILDQAKWLWAGYSNQEQIEKFVLSTQGPVRPLPLDCDLLECLMEGHLGEIQWQHKSVHLDDIKRNLKTLETLFEVALRNLDLVFQKAEESWSKLKPSKCFHYNCQQDHKVKVELRIQS